MNIEEIYNSTFKYIYRYFYYKSINQADIEDLAHETFIRFYKRYQSEQVDIEEAKRILYGYSSNIYKEWCRKSYKEKKVQLVDNLAQDENDDFVDEEYEEKVDKQRKQVLEAMESLKPRVKYVLESRFIHGMSRKEIAEQLNISEKDVHTYQKRGIKYLSKKIHSDISSLKFIFL